MDSSLKKFYNMSVVLLGNFSPMMFQPYWLLKNGIIDQQEFDSIDKSSDKFLITNALTVFETNNFTVRIEQKRFMVMAKKEPFVLLVDFIDKLYEAISGIQIEKFGVNFSFHISLQTKENMKRFGDAILPKEPFGNFFDYSNDTEDKKSGLLSMTLKRYQQHGYTNLKIETSLMSPNSIFFDFNNHFEKENKELEPYMFIEVVDLLKENYENLKNKADEIVDELLENTLNDR